MSNLIGAYIEITGACNAACPYCYNEKLVNTGKSLPLDKLSNLVYQLREYGIVNIAFSGGEPFLYDSLYEILQVLKKLQMNVTLISNGTCFNEEFRYILKEFQPNLQITFDGYNHSSHDLTRGSGNFMKITERTKEIRQNGYLGLITARVNLHKNNISHMNEFLSMFEENFNIDRNESSDINHIGMALLHPTESDSGAFECYLEDEEYLMYPEIFDLFSEWNKKHSTQISHDFNNPDIGCPYNASVDEVKCSIRVAVDGNVFPCQMFTDDAFILGNILNDTLEDIMKSKNLDAFIEAVHNRKSHITQCKSCGYKVICAGGCPAQAYIKNHTLNSVTTNCASRKKHFNKNLLEYLHNNHPIAQT
jgi:radical SAM protein with 4Fe4S-binding SPASM domain